MLGKQIFRVTTFASVAVISAVIASGPAFSAKPIQLAAVYSTLPATSVQSVTTPNAQTTTVTTAPTSTVTSVQVPQTFQPSSPVNVVQPTPGAQIWNLKNADIRAVIQTISVLTGKNFIIDPRVHGTVSLISQKPMTPDEMYQVFLSMLQTLQFSAVKSGDVVKVVPSMDANSLSRQIATNANPGVGDEIVVRVVPVNHVSATELVPVLRPLMSQSGSVTAYLPSNTLILAGTASNVSRLVEMINKMDSTNQNQIAVVHLKYANAKNLVNVIQRLQSGGAARGEVGTATLAAYEADNSILVSGNMANQLMMRHLISELDQKGSGGDDTRVVYLNYLSAKKMAPILAKIAGGISSSDASTATGKGGAAASAPAADNSDVSDGKSSISIEAETNNNAIIMHAPKSMLTSLMQVVRRLDVRPKEVLVEAIIVKVDENLLNQLGIIWGTPGASDPAATATPTSPSTTSTISNNNRMTLQFDHGLGFLPGENLTALLHLLKSNGSSDVLSTPSVVVLNNDKASIIDGQNIGEANRSYQSTTVPSTDSMLAPYNTIQRTDVALSLDVTPHISPNNTIRMELLQKDDSVASDANSSTDNPTINTSKIKTSVLVRSGDVLVLGGLISNQQEKTHQKLPILGDIPVLGKLFRYDTSKLDKQSLMVFIRPVIMSKHIAHQQTMDRYAYVRGQQVNIQTDRVTERPMPLLPPLKHDLVHLPAPVSNQTLPLPTTTLTTGTAH